MKKLWKNYGTKLVSFFLVIVLLCAATNCGTRKKEAQKEYVKKDSITSLLKQVNLKVDSNYTIDFSSFKIYPIDVTKPIIYNGNTMQNASIENINKKEVGSVSKTDKSIIKQEKKGSSIEYKKEVKKESSDNSNLWIGLFFVVCLFVFLYLKLPSIKKPLKKGG